VARPPYRRQASAYAVRPIVGIRSRVDTARMSSFECPACRQPAASIGDVVTSAELLAALVAQADENDFEFEPQASVDECFVYTLCCAACDERSLHATERLEFADDPEPIG
jgi:transcription elongation factor Elf1